MHILIVGAGPAGSSSAIQLSKAGFDITLIDINSFPRFKPGESCHPGIETLLYQLDVWENILEWDPIRYNSIVRNINGIKSKDYFSEDKLWQGFQFPRETFDMILLNKAIELGTKFIQKIRIKSFKFKDNKIVSAVTNKGELNFDFIVDATGSKSLTSRKTQLIRNIHSKRLLSHYCQISTVSEVSLELNSYFEVSDGYWGYISLIKPNLYSVSFSSPKRNKQYINYFIQKHFNTNCEIIMSKGFDTSWSLTINREFTNLYIAGDALMTFDPTSSKGILKAIMSGIYSAHILTNIQNQSITKLQGLDIYNNWALDFFEKEKSSVKKVFPNLFI